jgi:hypothetical protein
LPDPHIFSIFDGFAGLRFAKAPLCSRKLPILCMDRFVLRPSRCSMSTRSLRIGLSFIVALGCWIGKIQAQEPPPNPAPAVVASNGSYGPAAGAAEGGRLNAWLHRQGYCCGSHLDWYGCGGIRSQCLFVWGSCRTFFGEPCLPKSLDQQGHGGINGGSCPGGCHR